MREKRILKLVVTLLAAVAMQACSTVETAPKAADERAKTFEVTPGKANLYVVQTGGWFPGFDLIQTFVNAQPLGALAARTYNVTAVAPGNYVVIGMGRENQQSVNIKAEAGKNYFIGMGARVGWNHARVATYRMAEEEGKQALREAVQAAGFNSAEDESK